MGSLGIIAVREMTMTWSRKVLKKGSDNANLCVCVCVRTREKTRGQSPRHSETVICCIMVQVLFDV